MSLFDVFRAKHAEPAAPAAPASPWQQRLAQAERTRHFAWLDSNEPARAFVRELLTEAAPAFGNGKVVDAAETAVCSMLDLYIDAYGGEAMNRHDRNVELHGLYDGRPIRIPISIPGKRIWAMQMTCADSVRYFRVVRDPSRVPHVADPNDPWETSQPPDCVFVGKGIYLFNYGLGADHNVPQWGSTPAPARALVLREMEQLDLCMFELSNTENSVFALGYRPLHALEDPLAFMQACAGFLAEFVKLQGVSASAGHAYSTEVAREPVTCRYCTSRFYLAPEHSNCPNCGAPAT